MGKGKVKAKKWKKAFFSSFVRLGVPFMRLRVTPGFSLYAFCTEESRGKRGA
jgi:hypothetical protein